MDKGATGLDAVDLDTHTDLDGDTVNIDVKDTNNDFGDADYFDDLGDDAELEDLENFLKQSLK
ncbi:hypothetical protein ACHAXA_009008 [Cyclostephanos tholiformis]|uniref:Uncharacterized protein n=1 Tax=Cyclostephanos tholiformis TaxID=382380 RepID=A0ABD3R8B2_9STRA